MTQICMISPTWCNVSTAITSPNPIILNRDVGAVAAVVIVVMVVILAAFFGTDTTKKINVNA